MILDLNKKLRSAKKEIEVGKRITKIIIGNRDFSTDDHSSV